MPTYEFDCPNEACGHYETKMLQLSFVNANPDIWNKPKCPICGSEMYQTFTEVPGLTFKEGYEVESSKSAGYWRQAERDRITAQKKRQDVEKEKIRFKDPETMAKQKRLQQNQRNNQ